MVDVYLSFDEHDAGGAIDWSGYDESSGPPKPLAVATLLTAVIALACHLLGARTANWAGYLIGAVATPILAIAFYAVDRKRARSRSYIPETRWTRTVSVAALAALAIGFTHAYFASQSSYYA